MRREAFQSVLPIIAMLALTGGTGALAETPNPTNFRGVINDYTPASTGGPWEVRGHWSLAVKDKHGRADCKADFSAAFTMERSDEGVTENGHGDFNGVDPMDRMAHTHHITLLDGVVTTIPGGIQVTGPATITGNGTTPPPFSTDRSFPLTIQITGGNTVAFSNIAVVFAGDAAKHFGGLPIHGVVRTSK
jgi:hypothetical protein